MPTDTSTKISGPKLTGRPYPNIHICGNPGTGKSTLAKKIAAKYEWFEYFDLGDEARKRGCIEGRDEELQADIVNYDRLASVMEPDLDKGGKVLDWIHSDFWEPGGIIDLVVVLTCNNTVLYDRYTERGYSKAKIDQNIDSEIMQEIVEETKDYYENENEEYDEDGEDSEATTVMVCKSETEEDMAANVEEVTVFVDMWFQEV